MQLKITIEIYNKLYAAQKSQQANKQTNRSKRINSPCKYNNNNNRTCVKKQKTELHSMNVKVSTSF